MSLKMLREHLCACQAMQRPDAWPPGIASAVDVLLDMIDRHRPLAANGRHGNLHTVTCGCEDNPLTPGRSDD